MALLWLDGFDWLDNGTTGASLENALLRRYATGDTDSYDDAIIQTGRGGTGQCIRFRETNHYLRTPNLQTLQLGNTWIMGAAFRSNVVYSSTSNTIFRIDAGTTQACALYWNSNYMYFYGGSYTYYWDAFENNNQWYYIELKVKVDNSPYGEFEVRVNGTTVMSDTGVDTTTQNSGSSAIVLRGAHRGSNYTEVDDFYICDDSGTANNDFLGDIVVRNISPDADGDDEDWTTSSGTDSYALVNETSPADDDSDYVEDTTTGNRDLFTMGNAPSGQTGIIGVQQWTDCRITDATNYDLIQTIKQNSTLYPSTAQTISSQSFGQYRDILETDPDTGVAWTETGLNAIQSGVEVG